VSAQPHQHPYVSGSLYEDFRNTASLKFKGLFRTILTSLLDGARMTRAAKTPTSPRLVVACILALVINATFGRGGPSKATSFIDMHMLCGLVEVEKLTLNQQKISGLERDVLSPIAGPLLPLLPHLDNVFKEGMDEKFGALLAAQLDGRLVLGDALSKSADPAPVQSFGSSRRFV
jgi:hypothetical protein